MTTFYRIRVGTLTLTEARDVSIPQSYAAYHETVRVQPGIYPVYAYVIPRLGCEPARVHSLSARAEGITTSCYYGRGSQERVGRTNTAHIELATYGVVSDAAGLLAQAELCDALTRKEWDSESCGQMWRFEIRDGVKIEDVGNEPYYQTTREARFA